MDNKQYGEYPVNSIHLCFNSCDNTGVCKGVISGVALEKEIPFNSVEDLVIKIDNAFNKIGQPQPNQVLRTFSEEEEYQSYIGKPPHWHSSQEIACKAGNACTIDLVMLSRHRAEWQGILQRTGSEERFRFGTILECIKNLTKLLYEKA